MSISCGVEFCQTEGWVEQATLPLSPLSQSPDNRLYAETLYGKGVVRYFSAGVSGKKPSLDMTFAVGGYIWYGSPPEICWAGFDRAESCVLLLWHPERGLRKAYWKMLPEVFQIRGVLSGGVILLEEGLLQQDFKLVSKGMVSVRLPGARPATVGDVRRLCQPLRHYQQRLILPKRGMQGVIPVLGAGEYLHRNGHLFIRVAVGEGEVRLGSVWENRSVGVYRVSETLLDVCSIFWSPLDRDVVVASTNSVYGEHAGIYIWSPPTGKWQVIRVFPKVLSCQIVTVSDKRVLRCRLWDGTRSSEVNVSL